MSRKRISKQTINKRKKRAAPAAQTDDSQVNLAKHQKRLKYLKTRREMKQWQIRLIRMRSMARLVSFVLIIWLFFYIAKLPQWYLPSDIFSKYPNSNLEIEGNKIIPVEKILSQLKNVTVSKTPMYLLSTKLLEKQVLALAPAKNIYIRRFWFPARLKIVIDEKLPVLAISPSPKVKPVAVFNEDASITGRDFLPLPANYKLYTVITYDDFKVWNKDQLKYLITLSDIIERESKLKLEYIDIRNPDDTYAQLKGIRLRLGELNGSLLKRIKRVGPVVTRALSIKQEIEYVDLRWDSPDTLAIKLKENKKSVESKN